MPKKKEVTYPVSKQTLHDYAEKLFAPIRRGENVTTIWAPMAGRRMLNKFIVENNKLFENELPNFKKYILVYVEPLDLTEESLSGYLRLIAKSFVQACDRHPRVTKLINKKDIDMILDESVSYSKLLDKLRSLLMTVGEAEHEAILFLGEFDELHFANKTFYHNLKSLWSHLYPTLHYIFVVRERVTREERIDMWGELNEVILQNILYVPLLEKDDIDYVFGRFSKEYSFDLSQKQKEILVKLCGGHPYLLKVCFRVLSRRKDRKYDSAELESMLRGYYEIRSVARGILNVRSAKEKEVLRGVVESNVAYDHDTKDILIFLENIGIINPDSKGKYSVFGKIFEDAITDTNGKKFDSSEDKNGSVRLDEESGAILYNGNTVEEKFTRQEYVTLSMFLENAGKLRTRDDIGDVLWGKESYEKYSDWAIDQLMSKLRKKLKDLGVASKLVTVRGKGYKLIS